MKNQQIDDTAQPAFQRDPDEWKTGGEPMTDPIAIAPTIRKVMTDLDRTQAVYDVQTLEDALATSVAPGRFTAFLMNAFALTALLLSVVGIYGVIA